MNAVRPSVRLTSRILTVGSFSAAALLGLGLVLHFANQPGFAGYADDAGLAVLLLTPAAGLGATWSELRAMRPTHARLAVAVLVVLGLATVIALLPRA